MTPNGTLTVKRAYYHCSDCSQGICPADAALGFESDCLSPGLRPLVVLAGTLASFETAADDILRRFSGVRVSSNTVWRATEQAGAQLADFLESAPIVPKSIDSIWDFQLQTPHVGTVGYVGLDAFSVPMQLPNAKKAEGRMMYLGTLYTPDKSQTEYVTGWDMDEVTARLRRSAIARGYGGVDAVVAIADGGSGIAASLKRAFHDGLPCVLDWYHMAENVHTYAKERFPNDSAAANAWSDRAKGVLRAAGGAGLLAELTDEMGPELAGPAEGRRKLMGYLKGAADRTDYPGYRAAGWDIGSGPTEAGCKVIGARMKGSGMRWCEDGAAQVAGLRALYESGPAYWDAYWAARDVALAA